MNWKNEKDCRFCQRFKEITQGDISSPSESESRILESFCWFTESFWMLSREISFLFL